MQVVASSLPNSLRLLLLEQSTLSSSLIHSSQVARQWQDFERLQRLRYGQSRHAHNLSNRYKVLETKIRPKDTQERVAAGEIYPVPGPGGVPIPNKPVIEVQTSSTSSVGSGDADKVEMEALNQGGSKSILRPKPRLFKGVLIPIKPPPPASDECCMSSCTVCVYDLYAQALEDYDDGLSKAREQLTAKGISTNEWPTEVLTESDREKRLEEKRRRSEGGVDAGRRMGVVGESEHERQMAVIIGAFVKFEQELREKRKRDKSKQSENSRSLATDPNTSNSTSNTTPTSTPSSTTASATPL